jgi:hypothetical protein
MFGTMTTRLLQSSTAAGGLGSPTSSRSSTSSLLSKATGSMLSLQLDSALGAAVSLGASLFLLRVAVYSYGTIRGTDDGTSKLSLMSWIRSLLRKLLLDDPNITTTIVSAVPDQDEENDYTIVSHQGSCHCESIQFEVLGPRTLMASTGPGKIQYHHTYIKTTNFRVTSGHEWVKTYYVFGGPNRKGAHGFCERCGVHVLYAPSRNSPMLGINVNCIKPGGDGRSVRVRISQKVDGISDGFPADGQWDTSDHLSTISEVTQPFHFQMNHSDSMEMTGHWKQYSRGSSGFHSYEGGVEDIPEEGPPITQFYASTASSSASVTRKFVSTPVYPQNPITPTTITSTTGSMDVDSFGDDQISQLKVMVPGTRGSGTIIGDDLTNDDISLSDEASISSGRALSVGGNRYRRSIINNHSSSKSVSSPSLGGGVPASSPELRNQMRYFMGKYKHHQPNQNGDHGSQQSMATASTTASSLTSSGHLSNPRR